MVKAAWERHRIADTPIETVLSAELGTSCSTSVQLWRGLVWGDHKCPRGAGGHFALPCLELNCARGSFHLRMELDLN